MNDPVVIALQSSAPAVEGKKKHVKRTAKDISQRTRLIVQSLFIVLNVWLCAQFYLFVRYFEGAGVGPHVSRPAGVDGWLPIAGLMNTRYFVSTGRIPAIHPAAMILFLIFTVSSLLLKRAFCSWLCPVGTLSEYLWKIGQRLLGRNLTLPRWLDIGLRGIKYLLLAFFVFIIGSMSAASLEDFMVQPYGILADVKMLHFFEHIGGAALITVIVLAALSVVIKNFWCRYACPYGAWMSLASAVSPWRIRRDEEACAACGKCSKACPQHLPVADLIQVRSLECTGCMTCVASCASEGALQFSLPPRKASTVSERWRGRVLSPVGVAVIIAVLFFGGVGAAKLSHHWQTNISDDAYRQLIPHVDDDTHPGF